MPSKVTVPNTANSFQFNGVNYGAGDQFQSDNPCEILDFANAFQGANPQGGRRDDSPDFWKSMQAACPAGTAPPVSAPASPAAEVDPSTTGGDSAQKQGAPNTNSPGIQGGTGGETPTEAPPEEPQPGQAHQTHGNEQTHNRTQGGDPVDLFRGCFSLEETDLLVPTAVMPLALIRRYRSGAPNRGPFGWNWDHNHNVFVRELDNGDVARWDGALHEDVFHARGTGFDSPRGVFQVLEEVPGLSQIYEITAAGGLVWRFERPLAWTDAERIPLAEIRDQHGNRLRYTYNTDNRIAEVRDDDNRFFQFRYGECGLLEAVRDHAGRQVLYDHASDVEHLAAVRFPPTTDHPQGTARYYDYAGAGELPELQHNIIRIEDQDGRTYLENEYEPDPAEWSFSRVTVQRYGEYMFQYRYDQLQWVPPDAVFVNVPSVQVEVMAPDYGVTTYTFNYRGDLLDHRLRLVKDKTFRVVAFQYDYDEEGNLSGITEPDGQQELRVYDRLNADPRMRGKLLRRERTAASGFPVPSRIIWRGEYERNFQQLRRQIDETGAETIFRYDFDIAPAVGNTGALREVVHPTATLPDGTLQPAVTRFETNARGEVTSTTAPNGTRDEMEYGAAGNGLGRFVLKRRDAGGVGIEERFEYDAFGFLEGITDGTGAKRRMVHNALGQVERRVSPVIAGATADLITHFDADGKVSAIERPRGSYTDAVIGGDTHIVDRFERNVLGHPQRMVLAGNTAAGRTILQCLDYRGYAERVDGPGGAVNRAMFDERGLPLLERTEGADGSIAAKRRVFDRSGRISRLILGPAEDKVFNYRYDGFGRLSQIDHANGSTTTYSWAPRDLLAREELSGDPGDGSRRLLSRKRYEYDSRARLIRTRELSFRENPAAGVELVEEYFYDEANQLRRVVDARGGVTRHDYDGAGRLTRTQDPEGNEQLFEFDAVSRIISVTFRDQEGGAIRARRWRMEYDARGRRIRNIEPDGTETREEFDDRDLPIRRIEPLGVIRERSFGAFGELQADRLDPAGLNILNRWEYDSVSRPVRYIDPSGETSTYTYDDIGRLVRTNFPGGFVSNRTFGANGYLDRETLASGTELTFAYDAAGRLRSIRSAGAGLVSAIPDHTFGYDGRNNVVLATAGSVTVARSIDSFGRLIRESTNGEALELFYDDLAGTRERRWPDGRVERMQTNLNGKVVQLTRTAAGSLGSGGPALATLVPSGASHFGSAALPGGVTQSALYDARKRLTELTCDAAGAVLTRAAYRYDARSRRRVELVSPAPVQLRRHQYDRRDRVTGSSEGFAAAVPAADTQAEHDAAIAAVDVAAAASTRVLGFDYDAADDRTRFRETGSADRIYTYSPGHRIATVDGTAFTYSADGTRTGDGVLTYITDALGRVIRAKSGSTTVFEVKYDAFGRPSVMTEGAGQRRFHYFGDEIWQESDGGAAIRQFTPHPAMAGTLAMHVSGATFLTAFDGRLNLTTILDLAGQPVEHYRYAIFGEPAIFDGAGNSLASSAIGGAPVFGGMYYLRSANLYLSRRRVMDPQHGVFLSIDPLTYADSPSPYVYAAQDPLNLIDPSGEFAFLAILAVMAVGALIAGSVNAIRQGIQIAEGSRRDFSWGELGLSVGIGAVAAPVLVAAPELAVPLAAYGVGGGLEQMAEGHYATGTFDIVTSLAPFGFKGARAGTLGEGTRFGQMRGLGESASWSTRFGRFNQIDAAVRTTGSDAWNRRFYRGTTYYEALVTEQNNSLDLNTVLGRQRTAASPPHLGIGLSFTEALEPPVQGSAAYWADFHGGSGTGGGPAIMEARIPRASWWWLSRQDGVVSGQPQPRFPVAPSNLETFVPEGLAPWFNQRSTWHVVPDVPAPNPTFSALWPTLFSPPFRTPDAASAINLPDLRSTLMPAQSAGDTPANTSGPGSGGKK